jgi:hypothetical protein
MRSLFEYSTLPKLDDRIRDKYMAEMLQTILGDMDKHKYSIEEMVDYFITELGNADFIRMYEKIMEKRIK